MKIRFRHFFGFVTSGGLLLHACSSKDEKNDGALQEPSSFQSSSVAEPVTVAAEISTDLLEVPDAPGKKGPASEGTEGTEKKEPEDGELNAALEADADGTPVEPAAEAASTARTGGKIVRHKVRRGDTLMKLSFQYLGNVYRWREILEDNRASIADFNNLEPGTLLDIRVVDAVKVRRVGTPYLIRWGDTLIRISNKIYGTMSKWRALWRNNRQLIHDPNRIYAGFRMYYLGESTSGPVPAAAAAPDADAGAAAEMPPPPVAVGVGEPTQALADPASSVPPPDAGTENAP